MITNTMTDEQLQKKGKTVSVNVERKLNLGSYENVTVSTHLSSGTLDEGENIEDKAEELAQIATRSVHKELKRIENTDRDELAEEDNESDQNNRGISDEFVEKAKNGELE